MGVFCPRVVDGRSIPLTCLVTTSTRTRFGCYSSFEVFRNSLQRPGKTLLNSGMINESTIEGLKVSKQGKVVIVWMDAITKLLFFIKKI